MSIIHQILKSKISESIGCVLPIKFTVALTLSCNSRCRHCNIWKIYRDNPNRIIEELSTDEWKRIFDGMKANVGWIEFTGGEPTLRKNVDEIVVYAYNNTTMFAGAITTNAVSPKRSVDVIKKILKKIPQNKMLNVAISLDGIKENHDDIRGIHGNFENAIWQFNETKALKNIYKNLNCHFAYTISSYNAGKFKSFYESLRKINDISISDITITCEHFTEYYRKNCADIYISKDEMISDVKNYLEILKVENRHNDIFTNVKYIFYDYYLKNIPAYLCDPKKMIMPCVAGKHSAYIDPCGNIYPCTQWNIRLGNLVNSSIVDIWKSEQSEKNRKKIKKRECPNCWTPCEAQPSWIMNLGILRGWW